VVASSVFVADPFDGFPEGTPLGHPDELSTSGGLHYLFSSLSFIALVAAAFIVVRRSQAEGSHGFARYGAGSAIAFLVGWAAVMTAPEGDLANGSLRGRLARRLSRTHGVRGTSRRSRAAGRLA